MEKFYKSINDPQPDPRIDQCVCAQYPIVGQDHIKQCPLYRQRGDDYERLPPFGRGLYYETWWRWSGPRQEEEE